ncbi:hypothetical protein [Glycomyces rhizosphaerae]|uniref:Uncharacterized protein n=1 Tax=Glycomyces rhizosphaerae TaxID=2054422 RepID=A0ABV7PU25_9ACTN
MSDVPSHEIGQARKSKWPIGTGVVAGAVLISAVLVGQPWEPRTGTIESAPDNLSAIDGTSAPESEAESTGPECVDGPAMVLDEETDMCFIVPDGWYVYDAMLLVSTDSTAAISSDDDAGWVATGPVSPFLTYGSLEETARYLVAEALGIESDSATMQSSTGETDNVPSATASDAAGGTWMRATVAAIDGDTYVMFATSPDDRPEIIEQIETVYASLEFK